MPSADRLLALSQKRFSPGLRKKLNQRKGDRGWAHLANHTCCARHRNDSLEVLSVTSSDGDENGSQATEVVAVIRVKRFIPIHATILTCYRDTQGEGSHEQLFKEKQTLARLFDCQCCEYAGKSRPEQAGGGQFTPASAAKKSRGDKKRKMTHAPFTDIHSSATEFRLAKLSR